MIPQPPLVGVVHETEIRIAPEISARLKSLRVASGQEVRKGETLAELSSPEIAASLEEAKANAESARANLAHVAAGVRQEEIDEAAQSAAIAASNLSLAKAQFARVSTLAAKNFASRQQYDEDAAALAEADAHLNLAQAALGREQGGTDEGATRHRRQRRSASRWRRSTTSRPELAKTTLTAPADGVARLLVAEPGEAIVPGQPVLTLGLAKRPLVQLHHSRGPPRRRDDRLDADA